MGASPCRATDVSSSISAHALDRPGRDGEAEAALCAERGPCGAERCDEAQPYGLGCRRSRVERRGRHLGHTRPDAQGFLQAMTAMHDSRLWQDVYLPNVAGKELYVKFTKDAEGHYLLISFKESES